MIIFPLEIITLPEACGKSDREKILQPGVRSLDLAFLLDSANSRGVQAILLGYLLPVTSTCSIASAKFHHRLPNH